MNNFIGIPFFILGFVSIVIAIVYFIFPIKIEPSNAVSFFVLKYMHSIVWVLLTLFFLLSYVTKLKEIGLPIALAKISLVCYVILILFFIYHKIK